MSCAGAAPHPQIEAIRAGLDGILASPGFASAERMRRFLRFVVEKTLAGEGESLKEYPVGIEVFDRGPDFDPRTDTIVRVEARRLRKKLAEYYEKGGRTNAVVISLPSGSYVPSFEVHEQAVAEAGLQAGPGRRLAIAGISAMAIVGLLWGAWSLTRPGANPSANVTSIAVLPFVDLSPGKDQEYLCDGISEELINALSAVPALKVAARTSAFRFKGKADDIRRVGAELSVEHIVEGSVRRSGTRLRVTAQLVRVRDGFHVWSRQFERQSSEIFAIQEDVARAVAASVGADLGAGLAVVRPHSPEAYREYLEGRHSVRQFLPPSTLQAVASFERAIGQDPAFAPAHAGLARAYMQLQLWELASPVDLPAKARAAATRALSLDASSAEAATELGAVSAFYEWDWNGCEQNFRRAIASQPGFVDAHWLFATACLGPQGRLDEALAEARRAASLDPLSPLTHTMLGAVHWYRREYNQALEAYDAALRLDPSYTQASLFRNFVYLSQGRFDLAGANLEPNIYHAYIQTRLGDLAGARATVEQLIARRGNPIAIAAGYAGLGQAAKSLDWLEKAADARIPQMVWLHFHAAFQTLHETPRYRAIRARMRLASE